MRRLASRLIGLLLVTGLAGCGSDAPERAQISSAQPVASAAGADLEIVQQLQFSPPMLGALDAGIDLHLRYRVTLCEGDATGSRVIILSYSALTRRYAIQLGDGVRRHFSRRSALLAALDRVRLPLADASSLACAGSVQVALDLSALPTPLRLPALLLPREWRLTSPTTAWPAAVSS